MFSGLKHAFDRYLEKLAKSNKELFGGSTPDCCKLNGKKPPAAAERNNPKQS